jgi:hypothetical protein
VVKTRTSLKSLSDTNGIDLAAVIRRVGGQRRRGTVFFYPHRDDETLAAVSDGFFLLTLPRHYVSEWFGVSDLPLAFRDGRPVQPPDLWKCMPAGYWRDDGWDLVLTTPWEVVVPDVRTGIGSTRTRLVLFRGQPHLVGEDEMRLVQQDDYGRPRFDLVGLPLSRDPETDAVRSVLLRVASGGYGNMTLDFVSMLLHDYAIPTGARELAAVYRGRSS